jgi:hypothetical protein
MDVAREPAGGVPHTFDIVGVEHLNALGGH